MMCHAFAVETIGYKRFIKFAIPEKYILLSIAYFIIHISVLIFNLAIYHNLSSEAGACASTVSVGTSHRSILDFRELTSSTSADTRNIPSV